MHFIFQMWHSAPQETRAAAFAAVLTGFAGFFWSFFRYFQLNTACRRLNDIDVSPDNAESNWNLIQTIRRLVLSTT
jgi:hypothetical protein